MPLLPKSVSETFRLSSRIFFRRQSTSEVHTLENFPSLHLQRNVRIDVFLPPSYYRSADKTFPALFLNDGQDMEAVHMADTLERLYNDKKIHETLVFAVHASGERIQEYGIAGRPDYKQRGAKAGAYTRFLLHELIPFLQRRYRCSPPNNNWAVAGFSLGGLSAFDIGWHHPEYFSRIGVFSGSFWWRSQVFQPNNPDGHRILHDLLRHSKKQNGLQFWLQTGTLDEESDRNNNGVIDSIDDTLDVIRELKTLGYREGKDIHYVEVTGGRHDLPTWAKVMPDFLQWACGR